MRRYLLLTVSLVALITVAPLAQTIAFLASPASSFLTGTIVPVEGGATLGYRRV